MKFQIIQRRDLGRNYKVAAYYNNENVTLVMNGKYVEKDRYDFREEVAKQLLENYGEPVENQSFADGAEILESDIDEDIDEQVLEERLRNDLGIEGEKSIESWKEQVWSKQGLQEQKDFLNRWQRKANFTEAIN